MDIDQLDRPGRLMGGVVIARLSGMTPGGTPLIACPQVSDTPLTARATVPVTSGDVGAEVALMFEGGDPAKPLIMGLIVNPGGPEETVDIPALTEAGAPGATVSRDGGPDEVVRLEAQETLILKCGRASITLTKAGKVLIRGAYVSSRSSGVNRLKGGSVHIN